MYQRWNKTQSAEVKYAIDKLEEFVAGGDRAAAETALAQLKATHSTYSYRRPSERHGLSHAPELDTETRA